MKLTAKLKAKLLEGAEDLGTYIAAARKAGISHDTMWRLRKENPELTAELEAAFERSIERDYQLARSGLRNKLAAMEKDPDTFDMPTARLAMARRDRRWGSQYKEVDVKATVAVDSALKEVEERGKGGA